MHNHYKTVHRIVMYKELLMKKQCAKNDSKFDIYLNHEKLNRIDRLVDD